MLCKGCHISYATFQRNPPSGSAAISEKLMGAGWHHPSPPPLHGRGLNVPGMTGDRAEHPHTPGTGQTSSTDGSPMSYTPTAPLRTNGARNENRTVKSHPRPNPSIFISVNSSLASYIGNQSHAEKIAKKKLHQSEKQQSVFISVKR